MSAGAESEDWPASPAVEEIREGADVKATVSGVRLASGGAGDGLEFLSGRLLLSLVVASFGLTSGALEEGPLAVSATALFASGCGAGNGCALATGAGGCACDSLPAGLRILR